MIKERSYHIAHGLPIVFQFLWYIACIALGAWIYLTASRISSSETSINTLPLPVAWDGGLLETG